MAQSISCAISSSKCRLKVAQIVPRVTCKNTQSVHLTSNRHQKSSGSVHNLAHASVHGQGQSRSVWCGLQLAGVDTTTSAEWFRVQQNSAEDAAMKQALHKGSMQDINIYSASPKGTEGQQIAGYTKLPQFAAQDPTLDGSVVLYSTLPGGEQYELNLGYTLGALMHSSS